MLNILFTIKPGSNGCAKRKDTKVYQLAFEISKSFPKEETYSLTDQIRRSSRSVGICL
ncbi:MAG: four helix bundle protein [Chitinophagaceae bacterium]